jgi:ArsR family transcriptional regulator, zinc-responsive transcriptional repressor
MYCSYYTLPFSTLNITTLTFSFKLSTMKPLHSRVEAQQLDRAAAMLKVLSHPKRLAIVDLLGKTKGKDSQMSVTDIYQALDLPQAIASQHLITLKDRGVLKSSKVGTKIYYSLAVPQLLKVIDTLEDYSGRL